jgi:hypothetical protein
MAKCALLLANLKSVYIFRRLSVYSVPRSCRSLLVRPQHVFLEHFLIPRQEPGLATKRAQDLL